MIKVPEPKENKKFEPVSEGTHAAVIYTIAHIGTVSGWQGNLQNKIMVSFELPNEKMIFDESKGPQPRVISQDYQLSISEKANLTKLLKAAGKYEEVTQTFDVSSLLGAKVLIQVEHTHKDGNTYANIKNVTSPIKGMNIPDPENEKVIFDYDDNFVNLEKLPEFVQNKVKASPEYAQRTNTEASPFE